MADKWMNPGGHSIVKHPGKLHRDLHIPASQHISAARLQAAKHSRNPTIRHEASLAQTFRHTNH
jgi:hypothetical protein